MKSISTENVVEAKRAFGTFGFTYFRRQNLWSVTILAQYLSRVRTVRRNYLAVVVLSASTSPRSTLQSLGVVWCLPTQLPGTSGKRIRCATVSSSQRNPRWSQRLNQSLPAVKMHPSEKEHFYEIKILIL